MKLLRRLRKFRGWLPVPTSDGRIRIVRWILLEGNRIAVTGALLTLVFASLLLASSAWTFEMQRLLTETSTVENLLETFMAGMLLLVPLVVSINVITLSHDITSIEKQQDRLEGVMAFRSQVAALTPPDRRPSDPAAFLEGMSTIIQDRAQSLAEFVEKRDSEFADEVEQYTDDIFDAVAEFDDVQAARDQGARFGILWHGLEFEYGAYVDRGIILRKSHQYERSEEFAARLDDLIEGFQLFATGKEFFKSLYYTQELSRLSRILLVISLPSILLTATAILAISSRLLPDLWLFGIPPLQVFMSAVITMALVPYLLLTSYMLRLATVAIRTATGGPFWLK